MVVPVVLAAVAAARWVVLRGWVPVTGWLARQLAHYPQLAYVLAEVRRRTVRNWAWCVRLGARAARVVAVASGRIARWPGWPVLGRALATIAHGTGRTAWALARALGRAGRWLLRTLGRWLRPYLLDLRGWLIHTAPKLALRGLWRGLVLLVTWTPRVAWWLLLHSSVATVWLGFVVPRRPPRQHRAGRPPRVLRGPHVRARVAGPAARHEAPDGDQHPRDLLCLPFKSL